MPVTTFVDGVTAVNAAFLNALQIGPWAVDHPSEITALEAGRVGLVGPSAAAVRGEEAWEDPMEVAGAPALASDGRLLYASFAQDETDICALDPATGELDGTFTTGLAGALEMPLAADGQAVFTARSADDLVRKLDPLSGSAAAGWTNYAFGADVKAIYSDGNKVFVGGVLGGGVSLRRLDWTTGSADADDGSGAADTVAVLTDGNWVFSAEGDLLVRGDYGLTSRSTYDHGAAVHALAQDRDTIFIGGAVGTGSFVVRRIRKNPWSVVLWSLDIVADWGSPAAPVRALHFDGRLLWVGTERGASGSIVLYAVDPRTGDILESFSVADVTSSAHGVKRIVGDGKYVYCALTTAGGAGTRNILAIHTAQRSQLYHRVAGGRYRSPWHGLLIPGHVNEGL